MVVGIAVDDEGTAGATMHPQMWLKLRHVQGCRGAGGGFRAPRPLCSFPSTPSDPRGRRRCFQSADAAALVSHLPRDQIDWIGYHD